MKTVAIAMICHAINAAYCQSLGDDSQPTWDDAPDAQKQGIISGVEMYIANPNVTPEQNHEVWYQQKQAEGWAYGEVLDTEKKLHPCFLPYEELPQAQKAKDYLFRATVHLVKDLPDSEDYLALSAEVISLRQKAADQKNAAIATAATSTATTTTSSGIAIQYIGNKSLFKDHLYNSALTFTTGQVRTVTSDLATKLLNHPEFKRYEVESTEGNSSTDTHQIDDTAQILTNAKIQQEQKDQEQTALLDEIDVVNQMTKDALIEYAQNKYQQKLNKQNSVSALRTQVAEFIHQFGVV
ncbi:RyR domain-containing protein [Acinetobacter sp. ANC 4193]